MTEVILNTAGNGLWSDQKRAVRIVDINLDNCFQFNDETTISGDLRIYFDPMTWDIEEHGLIYTDGLFLRELRSFLDSHGLPGNNVDYSEQGMQGDDFVSLDAGNDFCRTWMQKFGIEEKDFVKKY